MDLQCIFIVHRFLTKSLLSRTVVYLKRNDSASETSPISGYRSRQLAVNSDTAHRDMLRAPHAFLLLPSVPTPSLRCWMVFALFGFFTDKLWVWCHPSLCLCHDLNLQKLQNKFCFINWNEGMLTWMATLQKCHVDGWRKWRSRKEVTGS